MAAGAIHAESGMPSQNGGQSPGMALAGAVVQTDPLMAPKTIKTDARIIRIRSHPPQRLVRATI